MGREHADKTRYRIGGSLRQCRAGGHHRVKQRQCDGGTGSTQHGPTRQVFFADEHGLSPRDLFVYSCLTECPLKLPMPYSSPAVVNAGSAR
jgi:hypothetical protein